MILVYRGTLGGLQFTQCTPYKGDDELLKIKSISAAAYITHKTKVQAKIKKNEKGLNYFEFERNKEVEIAYDEYREGVKGNLELPVDLARFNKIIRDYKRASNKLK